MFFFLLLILFLIILFILTKTDTLCRLMEVAGPEKGQKKVGTQDVTHFMSPVCIFFLFLIFLYNI